MPPLAQSEFLDVPRLLQNSLPRARTNWIWYGAGVFLLLLMSSNYAIDQVARPALAHLLTALLMLALVAGMGLLTWTMVRRVRSEQARIEATEELVQLRRWREAAVVLEDLLSRPTRTHQVRAIALMFLGKVLARYHRHADAIAVCEHLIDSGALDQGTAFVLRLERANAMLQDDRLFDADRAIAEMRRLPQGPVSGALALVELYRDVKTGHNEEAVSLFEARVPLMRKQLGHRVAEAHALVAAAHDALGHASEAAAAWTSATSLCPAPELAQRYRELAAVASKYPAAQPPAEVA